MFKEINKMTGKVFENPENQQNMKVQVWYCTIVSRTCDFFLAPLAIVLNRGT